MNTVGMIVQQMMLCSTSNKQNNGQPPTGGDEKPVDFQDLITHYSVSMDSQGEGQDTSFLLGMLNGTDVMEKLLTDDLSKEEIVELLRTAVNNVGIGEQTLDKDVEKELEKAADKITILKKKDVSEKDVTEELEIVLQPLTTRQFSKVVSLEDEQNIVPMKMQSSGQFHAKTNTETSELAAKAEKLLAQLTDHKSIRRAAPELLKLLEQWTALNRKSTHQAGEIVLPKGITKEQVMWGELVQAFQKRNKLVAKQQYNTNAKVTVADVAKWLQHALNSQGKADNVSNFRHPWQNIIRGTSQREETLSPAKQQAGSFTSSMPMSKTEQFIIHMNQANQAKPADQQLVEQFQKVMKTSGFSSMKNGTTQLNVTLRPENMGDMTVKLTQINGEMTVKILVTSAAAKDMLESNMHQLKHMFSPHQVTVEKQEMVTQHTQMFEQEQGEQPMGEHNQESGNHSEQDDEQQNEDDFDSYFQEVLLNEEV
ncbi:flagellar hook-length control protein FliK [Lentibacillus cibarius]|uniref:Flagellar hook-length control protein FliK n=1 Tax=Lentibacillus cibarius TaxID=2583219 RepID=A0A549YKL2_9BACI|nr:flagellar hook-length control protein FliK [Lentibacillus cibarius]TRM12403.1 flagellar hook-length control protein FliK [Lentibacillus cibarius]